MTRRLYFLMFTSAASAIALLLAAEAHATPEYAQKFRSKCRSCHIKNTVAGLNQTGIDFKASLDRERAAKNRPPEQPKASTDTPLPAAGGEPAVASGEVMKQKGEPSVDKPQAAVPQEPAIFRWTASDGSTFFTDNMERHGKDRDAAKKGKRSVQTAPIGKRKSGAETKRAAVSEKAKPEQEKPQFRSYGECMEAMLLNDPVAGDADEMMTIVTDAERTCSPYQRPADGKKISRHK